MTLSSISRRPRRNLHGRSSQVVSSGRKEPYGIFEKIQNRFLLSPGCRTVCGAGTVRIMMRWYCPDNERFTMKNSYRHMMLLLQDSMSSCRESAMRSRFLRGMSAAAFAAAVFILAGCGSGGERQFSPHRFPTVQVPGIYAEDQAGAMEYIAEHF